MGLLQTNETVIAKLVIDSPIAIVVSTENDGQILDVNDRFLRLFGYARDEVIGQTTATLGLWANPERRAELTSALREGRLLRDVETTVRTKTGDGRQVLASTERVTIDECTCLLTQMYDISARTAVEEALREAEARSRSLIDGVADAIFVADVNGHVLDANSAALTLIGYEREQLLAMSVKDVVAEAPEWVASECARFKDERSWRGELSLRRKDGTSVPVESRATIVDLPTGSVYLSTTRDVSARKQAEAALRESEERFRSAFAHAPIGIALVAPDERFMQVNRALCEQLGYPEEELLGKTLEAITHPDDLADGLEQAARLWAGEIDTYQLEKRVLHKDGHVIWIHLTGSLVRNASGPKYSIAQIVDITGRRHVEMDRAIMLASEREYTRQLRTLTEMRADLTAMIAHELRAPVAALRMMTFLLATGELSAQDEAEMFTAVKSEIEQLDRLISDVADVTTAEREDFSVQLNQVPLDVLFENAAAYARVTLIDHPFAVPPAPEVSIWCDPERISQVLRNLLDNAAKHTPSGTAVALRAHRDGTRVHLEVADHGPGLPAEERDSIFEKFGRGHSAASRQTPGAGLGLYLSRQIVQAHGSELTVASAPGNGTVFGFDLEVAP